MVLHGNDTARQSHDLAMRIAEARLRGDHTTAEELIKQFNSHIFDNPQGLATADNATNITTPTNPYPTNKKEATPAADVSNNPTSTDIDAELAALSNRMQQLLQQKQNATNPSTSLRASDQPAVAQGYGMAQQPSQSDTRSQSSYGTLAEAIRGNQATPATASNSTPVAPANLPIDSPASVPNRTPTIDDHILQSLSGSNPDSGPAVPQGPLNSALGSGNTPPPGSNTRPPIADFKTLIADFHNGVQSLLKQYLSDFSAELETPEGVLGPLLVEQFLTLWRQRQKEEPLLLKLPEYIQQRSVLLRFRDELKNRLV